MKLIVVIRVITKNADGDVLIVKKRGADFWHYPGGKWEYDKESVKECAAREVLEETGYDINVGDLAFSQEIRDSETIYLELFFNASAKYGSNKMTVKDTEEIREYMWVSVKDISKHVIKPNPENLTR